GSLFQDQLLEREVRHSLAQPVILFLEFFQPLHLIALQAAELLAPAIIRELRHADRANRLANRSSLRQQNIDLAQLRDDLFGLMLLLGHSNVLSNGSIAYFREDHFSGGRPLTRPTFSPKGRSRPRISFSWSRSLLTKNSLATSSERSSWLATDFTCTALNQPERIRCAIDRASLRSFLLRFIATIAALA